MISGHKKPISETWIPEILVYFTYVREIFKTPCPRSLKRMFYVVSHQSWQIDIYDWLIMTTTCTCWTIDPAVCYTSDKKDRKCANPTNCVFILDHPGSPTSLGLFCFFGIVILAAASVQVSLLIVNWCRVTTSKLLK